MDNEIINAQIEGTMLGVEDHGIMTAWLTMVWGAHGQGFGGHALDTPKKRPAETGRVGTAFGCEYIKRVIETVGVGSWEKLKGKYVRIKRESGFITAIGHITEDRWFCPQTDLAEFLEADGDG